MVGSKVLFDTNILIDYLSGIATAQTEIDSCLDRAISIVTWMEVMAGATPGEEPRIRAFLATFRSLPLTPEIAELSETTGCDHQSDCGNDRSSHDYSEHPRFSRWRSRCSDSVPDLTVWDPSKAHPQKDSNQRLI